ncbi:carbohydrate ABC transporter permease [Streptomyces phaeochromogenes]|uniref:Carbohydrate ABC transporter permease n=1 Tax=Streptomyces phaeochromogenes TaxID=1923 RepID=A0ABZ1HQ43_STRPH|nr:carbohydrate ABC transporter permease [Streptomyces phaeochromogenes]WRZ35508.1 carbohydrate ABC transporter permease [Streptomyces phaeochromogenes]WSD20729.1 carbohydrate ABC transporter permease [Streptomyces phaeochromogenes]WSJ02582.1 carbohydrate ABC transporter permease [Streptomyces phaeochromogenes]
MSRPELRTPRTPRLSRLSRPARANLIALPLLIVVGLVWIYPFLWIVAGAFKTQTGLFTGGASLMPDQWNFDNFRRAWVDAGFSRYFFNTILYAVVSTVIELFKSALCGYILARYEFPGRKFLHRMIIATLFVPVASIIIPQFVLVERLGLLNTQAGVILAMSGAAGALYVLLFIGFFSGVPTDLFDAAKLDGAGFLRTFRLVLPLAKPVIAVVVIFQFITNWNEFNIPLVFTLGQPDLQNLAVGMLSFKGEHSVDWTGFAAGMTLSVIPMLIVFVFFQSYFVRGLAGATKE